MNDIRGRLPLSNEDYILRKYLEEMESVYEASTVGGDIDSFPAPVLHGNPTQLASLEEEPRSYLLSPEANHLVKNHPGEPNLPEHGKPTKYGSQLSYPPDKASYPVRDAPQALQNPEQSSGDTQPYSGDGKTVKWQGQDTTTKPREIGMNFPNISLPVIESGLRDRERWSNGAKRLHVKMHIPGMRSDDHNIVVARGHRFAGHYKSADHVYDNYGIIFRGSVEEARTRAPDTHELKTAKYDPEDMFMDNTSKKTKSFTKRRITSMALSDDGRLIASFEYQNEDIRFGFIIAWRWGDWLPFDRVSPVFRVEPKYPLSPNGQFFPHYGEDNSIVIFDTIGNQDGAVTIPQSSGLSEMRWSKDSHHFLLLRENRVLEHYEYLGKTIDLYNVRSGSLIYSVSIDDVVIESSFRTHFEFRFSTHDQAIIVVQGCERPEKSGRIRSLFRKPPPAKFSEQGVAETKLQVTREGPYCARIGVGDQGPSSKHVSALSMELYVSPVISPDGSCLLASYSAEWPHQCLRVLDASTFKVLSELRSYENSIGRVCFDYDGQRVYSFTRDPYPGVGVQVYLQAW